MTDSLSNEPGINESISLLPAGLVAQWHPTKNETNLLRTIKPGSNHKVWWVDELGHEWETSPNSRKRTGCPFCSGSAVLTGFNDIATTHPEIAQQWHPTKNPLSSPETVSKGSTKKVWWIDEYGHEWEAPLNNRTSQGQGCPICAGKQVLSGFNDVATTHPDVILEWHPTKNESYKPTEVTAWSKVVVWWLGSCGHEWDMPVDKRTYHAQGCPICAGKRVLAGFNDAASQAPELQQYWDNDKNANPLAEFTLYSNKLAFWTCTQGHTWERSIAHAVLEGAHCPFCSGRRVLKGFNDLETVHPNIAADWHFTKNTISPDAVTVGSSKKVWWVDELGHEWEASVNGRVAKGYGCPYCANKAVLVGFNDFAFTHPLLASEWDSVKNGTITADMFTHGHTANKFWWSCIKDHSWKATINDRCNGYGCPQCAAHNYSSVPEKELQQFVSSLGVSSLVLNSRNILPGRYEIDIYLPELKIGIEFNGVYWHSELSGKTADYHYDKWKLAKEAGIQLIQIWEDDLRDRKMIVLRALAHKLGATAKMAELYPDEAKLWDRTYARKMSVQNVSTSIAKQFLTENHIQGFASGSYYVGLFDGLQQLRSLMVLRKEPGNVLNIVRYASLGSVIGGFTKLLKYAERQYQPSSFITFADHMISDGGLYENNGFVSDKELPPDYMYVVKGERKHKFGYRLKRFKNDPALVWEQDSTERELAKLNGISRIWDAGKTRYRKVI